MSDEAPNTPQNTGVNNDVMKREDVRNWVVIHTCFFISVMTVILIISICSVMRKLVQKTNAFVYQKGSSVEMDSESVILPNFR